MLQRLLVLLLLVCLAGCTFHPLGMSDEEWAALSPQEKLAAREKQAEIDLKEQEMRLKREEMRQRAEEERKQREHAEDVANGLIAEVWPDQPMCIGGDLCFDRDLDEFVLPLRPLAYVERIEINMDDRVGSRHDAELEVFADNHKVKRLDVKKNTQWHTIPVRRVAGSLAFKAVTDDEIKIYRIKVYGAQLDSNQIHIHMTIGD